MKGGAGEQRAAKRQKLGTEGFSADTDLEVAVEGEVVGVHSLLLMLASPVFKHMLSHSMAEAASGRVELPGKSASEFKVLLEFLQPDSVPELTTEKATFLAQWCDEYQVLGLKGRCDEFLVGHAPPDLAGLVHAETCNLTARKEQCAAALRSQIDKLDDKLLGELTATGPSLPEQVLQLVWPSLCKAAGVPAAAEQDMPGKEQVVAILPFITACLKFKAGVRSWPDMLCRRIPGYKEYAKIELQNIIRNHGLEV